MLCPKKMKGKFALLHRILPDIQVIYFTDIRDLTLSYWKKYFTKLSDYVFRESNHWFETRNIGGGCPPVETDKGWLLIYHAVDDKDDSKYQMGAMLLDPEDPTKVLCRTNEPILKPTECYENEGLKYGVTYPCGSAIVKNQLLVYYGGADMVTCVASTPINEFLNKLKSSESAKLETIKQLNINNNYVLN